MLFVRTDRVMLQWQRFVANMPPPMAQTTFDDLNSDLHNAYVQTGQESMWMAEAAKTVYNNLANINANSNCSQNANVATWCMAKEGLFVPQWWKMHWHWSFIKEV